MDIKQDKTLDKIVLELYTYKDSSELEFVKALRQVFSRNKMTPVSKAKLIVSYKNLIKKGELKANKNFARLLVKRAVRTMSGVSVITVLSKPFVCPGKCVYCPTEPDMPKSYLSNEPAAARAKMNLFDPIRQVTMRIQALENNGHQVDKLEVLVLGGTWSVYPEKYQREFIRDLFYAANTFSDDKKREALSLEEEQIINEDTKYKIIGLTLETRPDYINPTELKKLRALGTTRVQLGVQHTDNKILDLIVRGHSIEQSIEATKLLKEVGLKVDHHYMPDLPGSTPAKDLEMMKYVYTSPDLQPDQIKIYPCVVNEYAELHKWYEDGKYKPFSAEELLNLLIEIKKITPPWIRINRLIRDIPEESIIAGNKITNLRQYLQAELKKQGKSCPCLRCREVRGRSKDNDKMILVKREYRASDGDEIFISFESEDNKKLYGFLRLRFNDDTSKNIFKELENASLVRELHVYGKMIPTYNEDQDDEISQTQHMGLGKKLMTEAENITKKRKLSKVAVISGIGVRNYYKKLGYELEGTYMTKNL
ncbi:MAG: tRNA uridine(34) 5-carboxymethylaminomethyl modification radical SAM/GNAT enzyme Elp3 [Candidatus Komeilibacteria bacterium]|jgi:ELP3 family radical SAM enzyme/protein acetyltransferase|nr:tRNA uridine(34) 5-carboxymethylaminomethyl modification radical SAM/GNAT enzyme Elp3 [Candidatus Komeilibacteria bacterium]MBT4447549.1 tRNA uridine(34) 5-carboxymethylaminomethyl modification radical SAM/GNAT enzyme Elp3 [Candidatus Komeilibacteria bacterium]